MTAQPQGDPRRVPGSSPPRAPSPSSPSAGTLGPRRNLVELPVGHTAEVKPPVTAGDFVGKYFAQGAAIGVEEDGHLMADSAVSMVRGAISSVRRVPSMVLGTLGFNGTASVRMAPGGSSGQSGVLGRQSSDMPPVVINLNYTDNADATQMAGDIANELQLYGLARGVSYG